MMDWSDSFSAYGSGRKTEPGGLKDSALAARLMAYKRSVAKRYRVIDPDGLEKQLPAGKLWISTKVDGELWFLVKRQGEVALCAYNGRVMQGIPVCEEAKALLSKSDDLILAGELFAPQPDCRPRCHHVSKALGDGALASGLCFHGFDVVEVAGQDWLGKAYDERLKLLQQLLAGGKQVGIVTTVEGDAAAAAGYYREWVATQKFEGLVVRSEQGITYKIKPTFTLDVVVVAYGERVTNGVGQVRELTMALRRDDGNLHIIGSVGGGFSEDDRVVWHKRLSEMQVASSFRMANREGTLCRFVKPTIVIEVRCNDLVDTDGSDSLIKRMTLRYDEEKGYSALQSSFRRCLSILDLEAQGAAFGISGGHQSPAVDARQ